MVTEIGQKVAKQAEPSGGPPAPTAELLKSFFADCQARGLTPNTIRSFNDYLRHFVADNPELPTDPRQIEAWLQKRGESFEVKHRGERFKRVQSFYKYLDTVSILSPSPIPKAKMGRPHLPPKAKKPRGRPRKQAQLAMVYTTTGEKTGENTPKVVMGGGQYRIDITVTLTPVPR